jgi:hypothetical protein
MKGKIKDILAIIGGLWVAWEVLNWLVNTGILHISGMGGY